MKEAGLASSSLEHGLTILRNANFSRKGDYYQAFFQLSIGLERLMKLILIENHYGSENNFPSNKILRGYGHKLTDLYTYVSSLEVSVNNNPCDKNKICKLILELLSNFAISSRYYNLDLLTQGNTENEDPLVMWKNIQNDIRLRHNKNLSKNELVIEKLVDILDDNSITFFYNEENNVISSAKDLFKQTVDIDFVQGYATLYTRKIITYLVEILIDIEYKYNSFPFLREYFEYINGDWGSDSKIRNKKNWVNK